MVIILVLFYTLILIIMTLIFSKLKIKVDYLKTESNELKITTYLYLFGIIPYFKYTKNVKTGKQKKRSKAINSTAERVKIYKNILKKLKFKIEKAKLFILIGTKDTNITIIVTTIVSILIPNALAVLSKKNIVNYENIQYKVLPLYNINTFQIDLSCILSINFVHIISIIYWIILIDKLGEQLIKK